MLFSSWRMDVPGNRIEPPTAAALPGQYFWNAFGHGPPAFLLNANCQLLINNSQSLLSKNGFNHGRTVFRLFIEIAIGIGIEIDLYLRRCSQKLFLLSCLSVYFSWRQEKYQKNRPVQLGLRLPSRKRFFRRGQELARFAVLKQPARFSPKKAFALGCAAMGGACH